MTIPNILCVLTQKKIFLELHLIIILFINHNNRLVIYYITCIQAIVYLIIYSLTTTIDLLFITLHVHVYKLLYISLYIH